MIQAVQPPSPVTVSPLRCCGNIVDRYDSAKDKTLNCGQVGGCILFQNPYNEINNHTDKVGNKRENKMAQASKVETEVRESISKHLAPNETLREYTWGRTEGSISAAYFLFGALGAALIGQNQPGFFIGLSDRRLILMEVKGKMPTGEVNSISIGDIRGLQ